MNEESHIIKPSILLKFLGAKNLNLKIKNLEINSIHKDNSNFDIRVSSDSLYINSQGDATGLSILNININNEDIDYIQMRFADFDIDLKSFIYDWMKKLLSILLNYAHNCHFKEII